MTNLERAKQIIEENFKYATSGLYDSRNLLGDTMSLIYDGDGLEVYISYEYSYFEVFGLSNEDFDKLQEFYEGLQRKTFEYNAKK